MSETKLTNADRFGRDGARTFGLDPDAEWKRFPDAIVVGWAFESPATYDIYTEPTGDFIASNNEGCKAFAAELQRRYNVHTKMLKALKAAQGFIRNGIEFGYIGMPDPSLDDPAKEVPDAVAAAIKQAEEGA